MTKLDSIEKGYWWEIKIYLENPSKEALVDYLSKSMRMGMLQVSMTIKKVFQRIIT